MKVYFSHGKESGPWGSKITKLANIAKMHGCKVDSIDYSNIPNQKIRRKKRISGILTTSINIFSKALISIRELMSLPIISF